MEFLPKFEIDHIPSGLLLGACGIKVVIVPVKLRIVGISRLHHLGTADHGWRLRITVVKQHPVANGHFAKDVSRLVVPDPIPSGRLSRRSRQIINGKGRRFGFDQPVTRRTCHVESDNRVTDDSDDFSL